MLNYVSTFSGKPQTRVPTLQRWNDVVLPRWKKNRRSKARARGIEQSEIPRGPKGQRPEGAPDNRV